MVSSMGLEKRAPSVAAASMSAEGGALSMAGFPDDGPGT